MELLNTMDNLESEISIQKNCCTITLNVGLHPTDIHILHDIIHDFCKTKALKSMQYIQELNQELKDLSKIYYK